MPDDSLKRQTDYLEKTMDRLILWIRLAEMRIPPIIAIDTTLIGLLATRFASVAVWTLPLLLCAILTSLLLGSSLLFLAFASFPRFNAADGQGTLLWFGGIAALKTEQFIERVANMSSEEYFADLLQIIFVNSKIAKKKYFWIRYAWIAMFCSLLPWAVTVFYLFQPKPV